MKLTDTQSVLEWAKCATKDRDDTDTETASRLAYAMRVLELVRAWARDIPPEWVHTCEEDWAYRHAQKEIFDMLAKAAKEGGE